MNELFPPPHGFEFNIFYKRRPEQRYKRRPRHGCPHMIAHLRGTLLAASPGHAIVDCHGVGYDVTVSMNTFAQLPAAGSEVSLFIYTHVREDQIALFGFHLAEEKALFEKLLSVSGIGPKLAVNILGGMSTPDLVAALRGADAVRLTRMPGVGKKTAERMVLELKDKLVEFGVAPAAPRPGTGWKTMCFRRSSISATSRPPPTRRWKNSLPPKAPALNNSSARRWRSWRVKRLR